MRRLMVVAATVHAATAFAAEYGGETQGVTADELTALAAAGEIDAEALEALLSLHDDPPDPAHATPEELGLLPGVGRAEARRQLVPPEERETPPPPWGRLDAGLLAPRDAAMSGFTRLRLAPSARLAASLLAVVRERTRFASRGDLLVSDGPGREVGLERWSVTANLGGLRLIAGSYNCNFGESLTFSSARRLYAAPLEPADALSRGADARGSVAVRALRGLAARLELGSVELTGFGSYRSVDLYQYGEWQRAGESPVILVRGSGSPLRYTTFSDAARETLGGVNLDVRFGEQMLGATAYVGTARLSDAEGAWSPASIYPVAPRFGAVGAHAMGQVGPLRGRLEGARTLAGGVGAIAQADVVLGRDCDIGLAARYYGVEFDNPFARSAAAPDELEGARARNERGVTLTSTMAVGSVLRLAASFEIWTALTAPRIVNGRARGRTAWQLTTREALVLEGDCVDKDLAHAGVYAGALCAADEADCARGARASGTVRLVGERIPRSRVALGVRHSRQDVAGGVALESRLTAHVTVRPVEPLAISFVGSERLTARSPELDSAKRLVALTIAGRLRDVASLELTARGEQRWDAARRSEPVSVAGALTLMVQL